MGYLCKHKNGEGKKIKDMKIILREAVKVMMIMARIEGKKEEKGEKQELLLRYDGNLKTEEECDER